MLDWRGRGESPTGSIIQPCRAKELAQDFHTPIVNKEPFDALSASKTWMTTQSCDHRAVPAVHTYTVATHRVTPVDIYKVALLMERRPLDKRKQYVHLQGQRYGKMCSHFSRSECACTQMKRFAGNTHSFLQRETWALFNLSLSFTSAEHSEKQREAEKHVMQEGAYCAMKGTDGTSHKPLGPSFSCLPKKTPPQTATLALLTHKAPLLLHPLRNSYKDVKVSMCNLAGRDSFMCD